MTIRLHTSFDEFAGHSGFEELRRKTAERTDCEEWLRRISACLDAFQLEQQAFEEALDETETLDMFIAHVHGEAARVASVAGVSRLPLPLRVANRGDTLSVDDLAPLLARFSELRDYAETEELHDLANSLRFSFLCSLRAVGRARSRREKARDHLTECIELVNRAAEAFAVPGI